MAKYKLQNKDIVFLRGAQEEMLSKLLQLHIAPNPTEILDWVFSHGVDQTIISYNFNLDGSTDAIQLNFNSSYFPRGNG